MKNFGMFVYLSRGGLSRDSGLHITFEAEDLEQAKLNPQIEIELQYLY
jgi:hypothetical protein